MIKGGNSFVPTVPLRFAVRAGVDVAALLLTEQGRVRGDGDIVFHGAPVHPSGAVRLLGQESGTVWLEAGLAALDEQIVRVLVVGSREAGPLRDADELSVEAFAPDGTPVARYDVTDAGGETAMVLAEVYRRAGGWKFRAVGQGYVNGLAGLVTDHGVDVAEDAPTPREQTPTRTPTQTPTQGQTPVPFQAPVPFQVPAPSAVQIPIPVPVPLQSSAPAPVFAPAAAPVPAAGAPVAPQRPGLADWTFGAVFPPHTLTGRDNDVITVNGLPPGPAVVDLSIRGDGYTGLWPLTRFNKEGETLVNSTEEDFRGRVLAQVPESGRLRLQLKAEGPWQLQVLPLTAATRLTEDELERRGPDVLLHTGGTADLALHYRGEDNLIVNLFELEGHDDPTALPRDDNVVNEIGKRRETVPLPEGPVIVQLQMADGPWKARLKHLEPHSRPSHGGALPHGAGPSNGAGPAHVAGIGKAQGWLRRGRR
ncbi:TerD family protein [Streptomyces sp. NPDC048723]|uniref:TerD family protein n=1 Tax=Streptomyces sp. NPDC048723 TaxID=3365589 RepID=UPI00371EFF2A